METKLSWLEDRNHIVPICGITAVNRDVASIWTCDMMASAAAAAAAAAAATAAGDGGAVKMLATTQRTCWMLITALALTTDHGLDWLTTRNKGLQTAETIQLPTDRHGYFNPPQSHSWAALACYGEEQPDATLRSLPSALIKVVRGSGKCKFILSTPKCIRMSKSHIKCWKLKIFLDWYCTVFPIQWDGFTTKPTKNKGIGEGYA